MSLARVLGQEKALRRLRGLLSSGQVPSALLFYGPDGVGKLLAAREFAKSLACTAGADDGPGLFEGGGASAAPAAAQEACDACPSCGMVDKGHHPDVRVLNADYQAGLRDKEIDRDPARQREWLVSTVRRLRSEMERSSMTGGWKAAIVDDAHRMNVEAQNALLKMLEEPPPRTLWILVTDQRERLIPTILSRTQPVFFAPLPDAAVETALKASGVEAGEAARLAPLGQGSVRGALELRAVSEAVGGIRWDDPLAPYRLSELLPKDLMSARRQAQLILEHHIRSVRPRLATDASSAQLLRRLLRFKRLVDQNVSPQLVLETAALRLQRGLAPRRP